MSSLKRAVLPFAIALIVVMTAAPASAAEGDSGGKVTAVYFWGIGCSHCAVTTPHIEALEAKYPQLEVLKYEVYHDNDARNLFAHYREAYGTENSAVPIVYIGDQTLLGERAITGGMESVVVSMIAALEDAGSAEGGAVAETYVPDDVADIKRMDASLTLGMVVGAAAADSVNPCAIGVMVLLLSFLTRMGSRRRMLAVGSAYLATVFLVYFAAGLGILTFLASTTVTRYVYVGAAVLSVGFGLVNVRDASRMKEGARPTLAIPAKRHAFIRDHMAKATVPTAVVLGAAVSAFELPCTGGVYLAILSLLGDGMTVMQGVPYLLLYNAIFVAPLGAVLGLFYFGASPQKVDSWRLGNRRLLRLALGLAMIAIGAVMLAEIAL